MTGVAVAVAFLGAYALLARLAAPRPEAPEPRRVPLEDYLEWTPDQWATYEAETGWKLVPRV